MKPQVLPNVDRRAWLAGCARLLVLGGITATTGVLVSRNQIGRCPFVTQACASCGELTRCQLPSAQTARSRPAPQENP